MKYNFIKILSLTLLVFGYNQCYSSETFKVEVKFYIEDSLVLLNDNFNIYFITEGDTLISKISKDSFYIERTSIPDSCTILFRYKKLFLEYNNIKLDKSSIGKLWQFKLDIKPFDEQEYWYLKEKLDKIKWIYTLDTGQGRVLTEYRFKKPPRSFRSALKAGRSL